ncbi:MAG: SRPBCC domain-containing protein [Candidatus Marsarchaeota archaeon]|jgi:carbon monoxide dehydrogenase subunit G|nr:SRPBCC domain-containing protein [Candidatus Marsarchaeota archaeon]
MEVKFDGILEIRNSPENTIKFLVDGKRISECIPDSGDFARLSEKEFSVRVKMGIGFVKGKFEVKYSISNITAEHAEYIIEWEGMGNSARILLSLDLEGAGTLTHVSWKADCTFNGIVTGMGESTIKSIASNYINSITKNISEKLNV